MVDEKVNFVFPIKRLEQEDFAPIEAGLMKDYYRNTFLKIIDKVRNI